MLAVGTVNIKRNLVFFASTSKDVFPQKFLIREAIYSTIHVLHYITNATKNVLHHFI